MEWLSGLTEDTLPGVSFQEQEEKPSKRLADPITTPRKGPLVLSKDEQLSHPIVTQRTKTHSQKARGRHLNRFPIPNMQRPIDAIEDSLGQLSLAELKRQAFIDANSQRHNPILPSLNPLMKYTPIGHYGNSLMESHTHQASGPMDILITYSRHATPRNHLTQDWNPPYYTDQLRHTTSGQQIRRQITPLARTTLLTPRTNTHQVKEDSDQPLSSPRQHSTQEGQLLTGLVRPTLAPHSLHAVAVHKFKPVTAQTILKGQRLYPHTLDSKRYS